MRGIVYDDKVEKMMEAKEFESNHNRPTPAATEG
jgi:hypothetical protein